MASKNTFKRAAFVAVLLAIFAGLLYLIYTPRAIEVEKAKVEQGVFRETIQSDGILRSKERYTVTAYSDGDIKRVPHKVGDVLKKGDSVTELFREFAYKPVPAPISGVVSKVYRESAGPINRGEPIIEIIDPNQLEAVAELLTTDAVRLNVDGEVKIENWAGEADLSARVTRISKAGFTKQSALGVEEERTEVTAELVDPPKELLQKAGSGFHIDVTFLVSEKPDVVKIPVGALFRSGKEWAVFVIKNQRAELREIQIIASNSEVAAVGSGLEPGETVVVYPGDLLKDGAKVK